MAPEFSGKMELLAPAGNPSVALAAFDAGADAVYCGLQKFNARERSENFTHDDLARLVAYAHKNKRKVYVTFNTLLKESELLSAGAELAHLAVCRPDAVIVQDPGTARIIREYFPQLTLHASTQMGIHNSAGLEFAREAGFKRVIMERQVSLDELRMMIPDGKPPVELELFVHGALCCCLSGSCLFSSWMGGWSGNRGKCKQPCRRQYFDLDAGSRGRGEFLFSPDDLCSLDLLDEFRKLGVCSLKIEGRLRRADYVEKVVRAYRTVLDAPSENRKEAYLEAEQILRGVCTRKTSQGFYTEQSMKKLIRLDSIGGSGMPCGKVLKNVPGGFEARMTGRLHIGDTVRVQSSVDSDDGFNMTVLHLESGNRSVMKVLPGELCFIRSDKKALRDSLIYRTGESGADLSGRIARLPLPKEPLDLTVDLNENGITVAIQGTELIYSAKIPSLAPARKHAVSPEDLQREFSAAASEILEAGIIHATVQGEWFLPAGELKEIRRNFWHFAEEKAPRKLYWNIVRDHLIRFRKAHQNMILNAFQEKNSTGTVILSGREKSIPGKNIARELRFIQSSDEEVVLPPFVPETELLRLKNEIGMLYRKGSRVFRITSWFQFMLFKDLKDVILKTSFPLPVCNSFGVLFCKESGAAGVQAWIELGEGDFEELRKHSVLPLELYAYGRPCIFTTRAKLLSWRNIADVRDHRFELKRDGGLTHVYPEEVFSAGEIPDGVPYCYDLRHAGMGEEPVSTFNTFREWA
ncbi:MAG: U32 family peptidase [Lentisphaeria bacterium]|nr:U32 family peptidase [Lentisphaeria bacterium]